MAIQSRPLTYDDLQQLREGSDERLELIDGEIVVTPSPMFVHQIVSHRLAVLLDRAIVEPGLGIVIEAPFDVYVDEQDVVQPDIMLVLQNRLQAIESSRLASAPSLLIEIISPSTSTYDRVTKRNLYARYGVPEYWLVDPGARAITIYSDPYEDGYQSETAATDIVRSATIPELSIDLGTLFASVPGF